MPAAATLTIDAALPVLLRRTACRPFRNRTRHCPATKFPPELPAVARTYAATATARVSLQDVDAINAMDEDRHDERRRRVKETPMTTTTPDAGRPASQPMKPGDEAPSGTL